MTREELLFAVGKWLGYLAGHYDGWTGASAWIERYFKVSDYFIEATQAGTLIAFKRGNVPMHEISEAPYDQERGRELADWFGREAHGTPA